MNLHWKDFFAGGLTILFFWGLYWGIDQHSRGWPAFQRSQPAVYQPAYWQVPARSADRDILRELKEIRQELDKQGRAIELLDIQIDRIKAER